MELGVASITPLMTEALVHVVREIVVRQNLKYLGVAFAHKRATTSHLEGP